MSDSLWPHELQHARLLSPPLSAGLWTNSCPSSQCCYLTTPSSVTPFSCHQSFPASGCFLMSRLFASGGQSFRASASASVLPMNIQGWFPLGLTELISLQSKGLSRVLQHHNSKTSILWHSAFFMVQLTSVHNYWKTHNFWLDGPLLTKWCVSFLICYLGLS